MTSGLHSRPLLAAHRAVSSGNPGASIGPEGSSANSKWTLASCCPWLAANFSLSPTSSKLDQMEIEVLGIDHHQRASEMAQLASFKSDLKRFQEEAACVPHPVYSLCPIWPFRTHADSLCTPIALLTMEFRRRRWASTPQEMLAGHDRSYLAPWVGGLVTLRLE